VKNKTLFLLFLLLFSFTLVLAQNQNSKLGITFKANAIDNLTPLDGIAIFDKDNFSETTRGAEIGFFKNLNKFINVGIPIKLNQVDVRHRGVADDIINRMGISADLVGQIGYFGSDYFITPYLQAGVGYQGEFRSNQALHGAAFPVGLGLNIRLVQGVYIQAQSEYRFTTQENREQLVYGVGILLSVGGGGKTSKPLDTDGDGITDLEDDCPLLAGAAELRGCPDSDGDKIADKNDDCPAEAGLAKFSGCPDTDDDGVMDKEDACPTEPGLIELKGCPVQDSDGDGVPNNEDACPTEAGTRANNGCPVRDGDGDGVADADDRCPTEAGPASNAGCPVIVVQDSDGDGVPDGDDRCPTSAGTAANNGCPEITLEDKEILNLAVSNVEFETARATLKSSSFQTLDQIITLMKKYPDYSLSIDGHTDSVGGTKTNKILSERRAKSCYDYLILKGISANRVNYMGYGESQPIADNRFKDGREKNRRVEFKLFLK